MILLCLVTMGIIASEEDGEDNKNISSLSSNCSLFLENTVHREMNEKEITAMWIILTYILTIYGYYMKQC
jgi:hypothetical protein